MQDISLRQEIHFSMQQQQKLLMTTAMKQAFYVMQLPILELSEWIKAEIENNPVLEIQLPEMDSNYPSCKAKMCIGKPLEPKELLENLISMPTSLFDHLMSQARYHFKDHNHLVLAQWIIGHLDDKGFLTTPITELSTLAPVEVLQEHLSIIQTFDPPGVGARTIQETLLIQLKLKQKENTLVYKIIESHFEDLLHNRLLKISKKLDISLETITHIIKHEIVPLNLYPGHRFVTHHPVTIIPDLLVLCIDDTWKIQVNHMYLPTFHLSPTYRNALQQQLLKPEEHSYLRRYLTAGKWLRHILQKRKMTLLKIGQFLLKNQFLFFQEGKLKPLSMAEAAETLGLHESTIARAVANKYIACPHGMFALKDFFCHGLRGQEGKKVSHHTLRHKLQELIDNEDKKNPFSDAAITEELSKVGIPCARRTVTKYRRRLQIATACRRKRWA